MKPLKAGEKCACLFDRDGQLVKPCYAHSWRTNPYGTPFSTPSRAQARAAVSRRLEDAVRDVPGLRASVVYPNGERIESHGSPNVAGAGDAPVTVQ